MDAELTFCLNFIEKYNKIPSIEDFSKEMQPTEIFFNLENYNNKALILDFDGTLRFSVGDHNHPEKPDDVRILPNRKQVLEEYKNQGYFLLGASNQSCISRNLSEKKCIECFEKTLELLGLNIDYLYCPHTRVGKNCLCRKPLPGMGAFFIHKYQLDPRKCIMVGDTQSDKDFANKCGFNFSTAEDFFSTTWC